MFVEGARITKNFLFQFAQLTTDNQTLNI